MDRHPRRIVCLTEETTETLYLLGAQERIVGISGFTVRPAQARKEKPIVSAFISADLPKIEALKPDLVLAYSDLQADIVRELVAHGYDVVAFNQHSVAEILRMIVVLGAIVGKGQQAQALAQQLQDNLDRTQELAAALPRRPRVYFEEWPDPIITGSRWVSELIEIAGGDDVFAHLRSGHLAKQRIVSAEDVRQREPEVILASWCGKMVKPQKIVSRPGFRDLPAVRNDRIHEIKSAIILQPGPAALTDGLSAMHARIAAAA